MRLVPPLAGCSPLRGSAPVGLPQIANPKRLAQGETRRVAHCGMIGASEPCTPPTGQSPAAS